MDRRTISLHVGARWSFALFACTLVAFVVESELTQYLQTNLGYRQPFFIFYLVHSTFAIIFPLHLLYLSLTTKHSAAEYINGLSVAITNHLRPSRVSTTDQFPTAAFLRLIFGLTVGITMPGLLWFQAISLASVSDVTAIWNANAFFAYLMTFNLKWEPRRLLAVILATLGVLVVVYGGSRSSNADSISQSSFKPSAPLVGDLLTLIASIGYALYQVLYKRYAALPTDPELLAESAYEHLPSEDPIGDNPPPSDSDVVSPPFGLHPNLLTSAIGLCTLVLLGGCFPILHHLEVERFVLPPNLAVTLTIGGIALSGVVFNAGFMVLLGTWGPIITSVGNLLTIVLVFISDILFGAGMEAVTLGGVVGCSVIVAAFGVLVFDMIDRP